MIAPLLPPASPLAIIGIDESETYVYLCYGWKRALAGAAAATLLLCAAAATD